MRSFIHLVLSIACLVFILPGGAAAGISVEGGLTEEKVSQVGQTYQGVITVRNQDEKPRELKIYQSDYKFSHEGSTTYGDPGKDARSNAGWISYSPSRLTVPPRDKATINYSIAVPADQSLKGTYWSVIMIECLPESSPESSGDKPEKKLSMGITQVMRYAIQVITHIGDTGEKKIKFLQTKLLKGKDTRFLQVDVENIGERLLRPLLWSEIYKEDGTPLGKFQGEQYRIYPNTSKRFKIDMTSVPEGSYQALLVADCGEDDIFGITYTLKFEQ